MQPIVAPIASLIDAAYCGPHRLPFTDAACCGPHHVPYRCSLLWPHRLPFIDAAYCGSHHVPYRCSLLWLHCLPYIDAAYCGPHCCHSNLQLRIKFPDFSLTLKKKISCPWLATLTMCMSPAWTINLMDEKFAEFTRWKNYRSLHRWTCCLCILLTLVALQFVTCDSLSLKYTISYFASDIY